uniref:Uncharacterized protein n=1 Tax=Saimiri boliviensis boliviensis TaxID=39432 RepID=A0A2K6UFY6_SAIBB
VSWKILEEFIFVFFNTVILLPNVTFLRRLFLLYFSPLKVDLPLADGDLINTRKLCQCKRLQEKSFSGYKKIPFGLGLQTRDIYRVHFCMWINIVLCIVCVGRSTSIIIPSSVIFTAYF